MVRDIVNPHWASTRGPEERRALCTSSPWPVGFRADEVGRLPPEEAS